MKTNGSQPLNYKYRWIVRIGGGILLLAIAAVFYSVFADNLNHLTRIGVPMWAIILTVAIGGLGVIVWGVRDRKSR